MLFKILHGDKTRISTDITPYHEGYCYVTYDGYFYIDMDNKRVKLNAKDAETLGSHTADEFLLEANLDTVLAQAKASGEFDGTDGVSATHSWSGTTLTITSASGTSSADLKGEKGDQGEKGATGDTGVGVSTVKQTTTSTADDGNNIITVTLTNGTTSTFAVQNGSKGSKGDAGYSPIRGTDYWTDADKAEIKSYVDEAILNGAW